jgi:transcriptional regulator with PAS, ATPase and Fis domain
LRDLITSHLPAESSAPLEPTIEPRVQAMSMEEMERRLIQKVLADANGNRKEAAKRLGIGERTLYRKLSKYDLN